VSLAVAESVSFFPQFGKHFYRFIGLVLPESAMAVFTRTDNTEREEPKVMKINFPDCALHETFFLSS